MTGFDYLKSVFARSRDSPYFSIVNMLWGATSGSVCWWIIFPIESIRRRMQTRGKAGFAENYNGIFHWISKVYKRNGIRGFYFGLLPACYKIFISAGIMFAINEKVKQSLDYY